jgi:hypothetical protein
MIKFSEYLRNLNKKRIRSNSVYQIVTAIRSNNKINFIGQRNLYYIEPNFNENSTDGELIRSGIYKKSEFAKLFIKLNKLTLLAKISPFEDRCLNSGFITEQNEFIIDIKE